MKVEGGERLGWWEVGVGGLGRWEVEGVGGWGWEGEL